MDNTWTTALEKWCGFWTTLRFISTHFRVQMHEPYKNTLGDKPLKFEGLSPKCLILRV